MVWLAVQQCEKGGREGKRGRKVSSGCRDDRVAAVLYTNNQYDTVVIHLEIVVHGQVYRAIDLMTVNGEHESKVARWPGLACPCQCRGRVSGFVVRMYVCVRNAIRETVRVCMSSCYSKLSDGAWEPVRSSKWGVESHDEHGISWMS